MPTLHFTDDALKDIEESVLWYEEQRQGLSYDFELCLEAGINEILYDSGLFQIKYKNVRTHYIKRFPFGIHYIVQAEAIIIVGVFHTSRTPKNWKSRR